ncbi:MAG: HNH endonuclease [Bacteroidales bacterium]|nr:HNH endonuclease [Bacteroidales bacterium]
MNPLIKKLLGFDQDTSDEKVREDWAIRTKNVCKPCWELKYCPYGALVEDFPLLSMIREEAIENINFIKLQLEKGTYDKERTKYFEKEVRDFKPEDYPERNTSEDIEKKCSIFGHLCPVFFVNEPFTETNERRRIGRYIPRHIMLKVVRKDNNQCQICGKVLKDDEIEFDHIIPLSKGGSTEEHNLRITCVGCNRDKSDNFEP